MDDLLKFLASKTNCIYISDLPRAFVDQLKRETIELIPNEAYSLDEWNETLRYLLREDRSYSDINAIKARMMEKLK